MKRIFLFFSMLFFLTCALSSVDISVLMKKGDEYFVKRGDIKFAFMALESYTKAVSIEPENFEALWKIGKTTYYLVDELSSGKEQKRIIDTGVEASKKAIKVNPARAEGYFWLGVNYAKSGQVRGVLKSLFLISPIKKNMRKVIELNESYEGGAAYITLGRVFSQVPGILGGSNRKALKNLKKAKKICNTNPLVYLFLAEVYLDLKDKMSAIRELKALEKMDVDERWIPETRKKKAEGAELLTKLLSKK